MDALPTTIIDAGTGNLRSLANALRALGHAPEIALRPQAERPRLLVLPGVGSFGHAARALAAAGWDRAVADLVREGVPLLGICLGMQLLFEESEESPGARGLALLPGRVCRFDTRKAKVPHIGWARLSFPRGEGGLDWAYFVHSYFARPSDPACVAAFARHGEEFPAVVERDRIAGVQFHPEKSQQPGVQYLGATIARLVEAR